MRTTLILPTLLGLLLAAGTAAADPASYFIWEDFGGTWVDAEKSSDNAEDNLLCWAASSSNILWYTGWGWVGGMSDPDTMFAHFQDHWSDLGGSAYYGWDWWFDGTNGKQGVSGWAQEDVDGGGGFFPSLTYTDYVHFDLDNSTLMSSYQSFLRAGYGTTISVGGNIAHSITGWGFDYDTVTGGILGLWVTDSDDSKGGPAPRPDTLRYYDLVFEDRGHPAGARWYMEGYGTDNYVTEIISLEIKPGFEPVPEPGTLALLAAGAFGLLCFRRRR